MPAATVAGVTVHHIATITEMVYGQVYITKDQVHMAIHVTAQQHSQ